MLWCMYDLLLGDLFVVVGTNRDHPAVKRRLDFLMTGGEMESLGIEEFLLPLGGEGQDGELLCHPHPSPLPQGRGNVMEPRDSGLRRNDGK